MKCGNCKSDHPSVVEVKRCFASSTFYTRPCKHELAPHTCVCQRTHKPWNWSQRFHLKYGTKCCYCREWMEPGDIAHIRGTRIAHGPCIEDPAAYDLPTTLYWMDGDALGIPDYGNVPTNQDLLMAAADLLLAEAVAEANATTPALFHTLLEELGEDMWDLWADHLGLVEELEEV